MAQYTIEINYTSNPEKSAKLILKNSRNSDEVFLGHAVLPSHYHNYKSIEKDGIKEQNYVDKNYLDAYRKKHTSYLNLLGNSYLSDSSIDKILNYVKYNEGKPNFIIRNDTITSNGRMEGYDNVITVNTETMNNIINVLNSKNLPNLNIVGKRKWFMFGLNDVRRFSISSHKDFISDGADFVTSENNRIKKEKEDRNKSTTINKNSHDEFSSVFKAERFSNIKETNKQVNKDSNKGNVSNKNSSTVFSKPVSSNSHSYVNRQNNRRSVDTSDNLDVFDVMYMNAFPDLAPIYRPNSMLAWMFYFNNQNNHNSFEQNPLNTIQEIKGFEGVQGCDVKTMETPREGINAYKVDLYEDEAKTKYLGTVIYDSDGSLKIKDKDGNNTLLSAMDNRDGYAIVTQSEAGSKSYMEVVPGASGDLVGNWNIEPKNAIAVSSSFSIDSNLSVDSSNQKSKTLDLDSYPSYSFKDTEVLSASSTTSLDSTYETSRKYDEPSVAVTSDNYKSYSEKPEFKPKDIEQPSYKEEYIPPPPPPPPPPPSDDYSYTTSDPYSSSSFKM